MSPARYVGTKGRMRPSHEQRITENLVFIKSEIDAKYLLDSLCSSFTITQDDVQLVRSQGTQTDRNHCFMDIILHRGPDAYNNFITALNENGYSHVSEVLERHGFKTANEDSTHMFSSTYKEIQQIQSSVSSLEKSLGNVKDKLAGLSSRQSVNISLQNLAKETHMMELGLKQKDSEIVTLREEIKAKEDTIQKLIRESKGREHHLHDAQNIIDTLKGKISNLEGLCKEQKLLITQLSTTVTCHENDIKRHNNTVSKHQRTIDEQGLTINELRTTLQKQNGVIEKQENQMSELLRNSTSQDSKVRALESENREQRLMITRQQVIINEQADKLQKQQMTLESQETRLSSLQEDLYQKGLKVEHQNEKLAAQSETITGQKQRLNAQNQQLCQQQMSLDSHKKKIGQLEKVVEKQQEKMATQGSAIQQQGEELRAMRETLSDIRTEQMNRNKQETASVKAKQKFVNNKWNW